MKLGFYKKGEKAQVTLFIIVAIVIVLGILLYFFFRGSLSFGGPPTELEPIYDFYLNCIEQETINAAAIIGQQGGYIFGPEFSSGSDFMPFSNYLNYVGIPIPYWYYISGNGLVKEQVPNKAKLEQELNAYLELTIRECDFSSFAAQGFEIDVGREIEVQSEIDEQRINLEVKHGLILKSGNDSWTSDKHKKEVNSNLGKFHELATKIFDDWKDSMFLENYGVDILRLYAPVDGVLIQCSPGVWNVEEVRSNLTRALEANVPFTKLKGDYYNINDKDNEYFVHDLGEEVDVNVNFLFSSNWPNKMEVWPNDEGLLLADPVGTQEGLGILGFCYVPYHFVYDLAYPVLVQMHTTDEVFQFPLVVYINKNRPRVPINGTSLPNAVPELCQHKITPITVTTYNNELEPIPAEISYKCFDTSCRIGTTSPGNGVASLNSEFPQCGNGYVIARSPGYETKKEIFSTINPGSIELFLNRKYNLDLELSSSGSIGNAIINFKKDNETRTVAYPDQKVVELSSGQYEIKVYVYSNSSIRLQGSTQETCVDVAESGVLGAFGFTEEKCFDMEIPSQTINSAISGGGTQNYFVSESELKSSNKLILNVDNFQTPTKVEDLQINYNRLEISGIGVQFESN